jgi:hypothetical protein
MRRGPPHETGLARSLHCGSVRILTPLICTNTVACPIQVMLGFISPALRIAPSFALRGGWKVLGANEVDKNRRTTKLQRVHAEGRRKSGLTLRNPPTT